MRVERERRKAAETLLSLAVEGLKFYADKANHIKPPSAGIDYSQADNDYGHKARELLAKLREDNRSS